MEYEAPDVLDIGSVQELTLGYEWGWSTEGGGTWYQEYMEYMESEDR